MVCDYGWINVVGALGAPFVALVAGGAGVYVAFRQHRTARNKLKFELFEERLKVYDAAMKFLSSVATHGDFTLEDESEFLQATRSARWVFDLDAATFLREQVYFRCARMHALDRSMPAYDPERKAHIAEQLALKEELGQMLSEGLDAKFASYLQLTHD